MKLSEAKAKIMNDEETARNELLAVIEKYQEQVFSGETDFVRTEIFWNNLNKLIDECGSEMSPELLRQIEVIRHSFF